MDRAPAEQRPAAARGGVPDVVLVTPNEVDARLGVDLLREAGIAAHPCGTLPELARSPIETIGCAVLVEEALGDADIQSFLDMLAAQPPWSDLPLVLIASQGAALGALVERAFPESGSVAVLERPLNPVSLVSAVRVGLRARQHQFEVRDLLEQRNDALRKRDEFLAMLAHELRNPLAPLRNAVYIMRQPNVSEAVVAKTRDLIDRQTTHLKRLVDDLLDVSRLELGKVHLQMQPIDLNSAVAAATEASLPTMTARGHQMEVRLAREPLTIDADPVRIEQIIGNLVTNAVKFTPERGHIGIEVSAERDHAIVTVRDDGVGIRPDMLANVFELFTQDDKTLERSGGGLGIGLTIVKRLVELHGGTIEASSAGQGLGSRFTVRFPRVTAQAPERRIVPREAAAEIEQKRVLVIEDNDDIRESIGLILTTWGHQVDFAGTGPEGLTRALATQPDVALIDIGLPGLNGYDVARGIRESTFPWAKWVRLIALTGYGRDADRDEALGAGFDCHLVKPVDPQVLARRLGE